MVSIEKLESDIKSKKFSSIYLFYGEELYLLEFNVKKIIKSFGTIMQGINYVTIDESNLKSIISEIQTPAFGYEKKLIVVKNSNLFQKPGKKKNLEIEDIKEKLNSYINENMKQISKTCMILFIEDKAESSATLTKIVDKCGTVCRFDYQKPIEIGKRLKSICNAYKVEIDGATLQYFIESCGTNMQDLINEIRKLIEYVGENRKNKKRRYRFVINKKA